jgi:hypothetical protein
MSWHARRRSRSQDMHASLAGQGDDGAPISDPWWRTRFRALGLRGLVRQFDPDGGVVAGTGERADFAVDASVNEPPGEGRTEQQMIDAPA